MPGGQRGLLILLLAAVASAIALAAFWYLERGDEGIRSGAVVEGSGGDLGGPFSLIDQNGQRREEAEFRGRYLLVYFGYTYCPDACPTALAVMTQALAQLDPAQAEKIQPIFISVDPARDTQENLKAYIEHFDPRFLALTGTDEELSQAAQSYRVYYRRVEPEGSSDYLVDHTPYIFLMGLDGKYLTHFAFQVSTDELVKALQQFVR